MSKRVLILVEGQTEERFVKDVLYPAFLNKDLYISATIHKTKRVKDGPDFKGGVSNFAQFEKDMRRILHSAGGAMVTTMIDYYGLPTDFPGMDTRPIGSPYTRVRHVENAIAEYFSRPTHFLPFLALHEFETWLFADTEVLPRVMTGQDKGDKFSAIRTSVSTPEEINERPQNAPSKRIMALFPGYQKVLHGTIAAKRIGLDRIRVECPHFDAWIKRLEEFAIP